MPATPSTPEPPEGWMLKSFSEMELLPNPYAWAPFAYPDEWHKCYLSGHEACPGSYYYAVPTSARPVESARCPDCTLDHESVHCPKCHGSGIVHPPAASEATVTEGDRRLLQEIMQDIAWDGGKHAAERIAAHRLAAERPLRKKLDDCHADFIRLNQARKAKNIRIAELAAEIKQHDESGDQASLALVHLQGIIDGLREQLRAKESECEKLSNTVGLNYLKPGHVAVSVEELIELRERLDESYCPRGPYHSLCGSAEKNRAELTRLTAIKQSLDNA